MRNTMLIMLTVLVVVLSLVVFSKVKPSSANPGSFDGVMPFTTSGGLIGFFDQKDGKVYLYDGNLENCLLAAQMEQLGKAAKPISKNY
jgi:hypothetical protein